MKKTLKLVVALLAANLAIYACTSKNSQTATNGETTSTEVKNVMDIPIENITCRVGGPGTRECKIDPGIKIGEFVTVGCGVTCREGTYACCGVRCICKPDSVVDNS